MHEPRFIDPKKIAIEDLDIVKNAFSGLWPTLNVFSHTVVELIPLFTLYSHV